MLGLTCSDGVGVRSDFGCAQQGAPSIRVPTVNNDIARHESLFEKHDMLYYIPVGDFDCFVILFGGFNIYFPLLA